MRNTLTPAAALFAGLLISGSHTSQAQNKLPNLHPFRNESGILETFNTDGDGTIDLSGAFFQALGTNGRSCFTCHRPDQGWGVSAKGVQQAFDGTQGTEPIFRTVDGSNCGTAVDTSTVQGRKNAYSLLLSRAVVRTFLGVPAGAEFQVTAIHNPYATNGDTSCGHPGTLPLYRRPIPTTNLNFLSAVQWDGRDSTPPRGQKIVYSASDPAGHALLVADLNGTTVTATKNRLQGVLDISNPRDKAIVDAISRFETNIYTAQAIDFGAGALDSHGATGGPTAIASFPFYIGINDPFPGGNPLGALFTSTIFTLYDSWANSGVNGADRRAQIVRGQAVFNNTVINITGVAGINDALGVKSFAGACGTCHDAPNMGDHSVAAPLNIGIADPPATNVLDSSYLPIYTLQNVNPTSPNFGQTVMTTDPGRALITGKWADIGKFKGPILRALASRAPYFHNGLAQSLDEVVDFYNKRFNIGFTQQQHEDLVAFLKTL